ncbi:flagellar motor switch/type III secretory pathway protein FliN [Bradyrhizobium sp. USDA 4524]|uniref:FliM/FliN family flagellar motor switch protein n=1 Tax=unclassified Bradyrhizobium TaxID=2631580 RepID=UPI00209FA149|nr:MULTISPECIES: FliM/FliN family flagellar motor switch protein [unclassified Bradyrhizobium]MCP1846089.1 type III secretion protein Q [Bradyrhizobium sp. USDA 4538]MCP1907277.1 type III secretion protein Q [Bradyrhizobium sp. USDA 4537]MCP1985752.1 type III secretion protein Q [Bradyrhizobium sp. USDA 4539]
MTPNVAHLPVLSPEIAQAINAVAGPRHSLSLPMTGEDGTDQDAIGITFGAPPSLAGKTPRIDVMVSSRLGSFVLSVEPDLCDVLCDHALPEWRDEAPGVLDMTWRAVLVVTQLAEKAGMDHLIASLDAAFRHVDERLCDVTATLGGMVRIDTAHFPFDLAILSVSPAGAAFFASLPPAPPPATIDPGFCCMLYLHVRTLIVEDYRQLGREDVLLIEAASVEALPLVGRIPGIVRFSANLSPNGLMHIVQEDRLEPDTFDMTDITETKSETLFEADATFLSDAVSDLPVRIDVLLKRRRLSLADLRSLAPGVTLDLEIDLKAPVTILANGAAIGSGHLLQLGNHIGVQITRWPMQKVSGGD